MRSRPEPTRLGPAARARLLAEMAADAVADAATGFRRNGLMTAAAVTTVTVALLTAGAAVLGGLNLAHVARTLESQVEVVAFLRDGTPAAEVARLQADLAALPGVAGVRFVGRAEALARLRQRLGDSPAFDDLARSNPLPDSLELRLADAAQVRAVAQAVGARREVAEVTYGARITDRVLSLARGLRLVAAGVVAFLAAVALVVVVNTIRLTVIARAREIEIMQLVGATRWFIRWPFILEGLLQGGAAAGVAVLLLAAVYVAATSRLQASLPFLPLVPAASAIRPLVATVVLAGAAVGAAGSLIAVRRFLHA